MIFFFLSVSVFLDGYGFCFVRGFSFITRSVATNSSDSFGIFACFQIENEYGPVEWEIGAPGKAYTKWAAQMAVAQNTGVPWVMCMQDDDAPDPVVSNSFYHLFFCPFFPSLLG